MDYTSPEFRSYAACASVLTLKMLAMFPLTVRQRFAKKSTTGHAMDYSSPAFRSYAACVGVLALKMLAMIPLTAKQRFKKKVFISPEDAAAFKGKVVKDDPDVERVRRAHQNDLENIPIFLVTAWLYLLTGPTPAVAINLFRLYTAARVVHTLVYAVVVVPQPTRAIAFGVGVLITGYMATRVILYAL